jgi:hypothetical protein
MTENKRRSSKGIKDTRVRPASPYPRRDLMHDDRGVGDERSTEDEKVRECDEPNGNT